MFPKSPGLKAIRDKADHHYRKWCTETLGADQLDRISGLSYFQILRIYIVFEKVITKSPRILTSNGFVQKSAQVKQALTCRVNLGVTS